MRSRDEIFIDRATARSLWVVCGLFFSIFSFIYLYVFQENVITALHYALAHGKTEYSTFAGAIVLTLVLWMVQWGINLLLRFKGLLGAVSYFPSFLLLGVLTDIDYSIGHGEAINSTWSWLLPTVLISYTVISLLVRNILIACTRDVKRLPKLLFGNLSTLVLGAIMTLTIGNSNLNFHHELAIEAAIKEHQWEVAREVGKNSLETTRTLSALRAFALSNEGSLGEYLFAYPQNYKSDGLLIEKNSSRTIYFTADTLYTYLGASPKNNESTAAYLDRAFQSDEGRYTVADYYLCALLLDKKLDLFAAELANITFEEEDLPRYYEEAVLLYQQKDSTYRQTTCNSELSERLTQFLERKKGFVSLTEEKNRMRREYGDTYWWYFFYQ